MVLLASGVAPACAGPSELGSGGASGGATGSGSGGASGGTTGSDAGGSPPQTALPAACSAGPLASYVVLPDLLSPASGSVVGSEVTARLCAGGASASLQRTSPTANPANQLELNIYPYTADPTLDYDIALPTDATRLLLSVLIGPGAAEAGTYTETSSTCGVIDVCAFFPPPASLTCATSGGDTCTPGCTFAASGTTCVPAEPETCWRAATTSCYGGSTPTAGSWRLTLSSLEPYTSSSDTSGDELWVVHGSLDATLSKIDSTSGAIVTPTNTATLSLNF